MTGGDRVAVLPARPASDAPEWEYHYSPNELAARWNLDVSTVRQWFMDEPGVLKHGHDSVNPRKRPYVTLRIPESVARRVYAARTRSWAEGEAVRKQADRAGRATKPRQSSG